MKYGLGMSDVREFIYVFGLQEKKMENNSVLYERICARFQEISKTNLLTQEKRILRYVDKTCDYGIHYSHDTNSMLLKYFDADWAESVDDRKIMYDGFLVCGNNIISCLSQKQKHVEVWSCTQLQWRNQLKKENNVAQDIVTLFSKNLSDTYIGHCFIRKYVVNKIVNEKQLRDIVTKVRDVIQVEKSTDSLIIYICETL